MEPLELVRVDPTRLIPYEKQTKAQQACYEAIAIIKHHMVKGGVGAGSYHIPKYSGQELLHRLTKAITEGEK